MVHFIYILLILILLVTIYYLYQENNKKLGAIHIEKNEQQHKFDKLYDEFNLQSEDLVSYKEKYESLVQEYKLLENSFEIIRHSHTNDGEKMTALQLNEMLNEFLDRKLLTYCRIFNNIIIFDGKEPRQIDHLVLCDKGCFIIETKHWKGDIFYNFDQGTLDEEGMGILSRYIFNGKDQGSYKTFVLKKNDSGGIEYSNYGKPYKQVAKTAKILYRRMLELSDLKIFIQGIVYFNYESNGKYQFTNGGAEETNALVANQKEELRSLLKKSIEENKNTSREINEGTAEKYLEYLNRYTI